MTSILRFGLLAISTVLCIATSNAQTVVSSNLLLVDPGSGHMAKLQVPALTGPLTYSLPNSNGTLLITNGAGVSSGWLLGGNDLSGPADNRIGSTSAHDVILMANGNNLLQLSNATSNVTLLDGTKLSFEETGGTDVSSFVAGAQTSDINYTLPTTGPVAGQVLTATGVLGNDVTLGWSASNPSVVSKVVSADVNNTSNVTWVTLTDLTTALDANRVYRFDLTFSVSVVTNADDIDIQVSFPTGATTTCHMNRIDGATNTQVYANAASPISSLDLEVGTTATFFRVTGIIVTGGTAGNLTVDFKKNAAGVNNGTFHQNSYLIVQN